MPDTGNEAGCSEAYLSTTNVSWRWSLGVLPSVTHTPHSLAAIRQAITNDEAGEPTLAHAEPRTSREQAGAKPIPEAGLLSRQATAAVGSAFNTLTETVRKHEPTLEDVVRETLRPMLKSWLDENLPRVVERMVQEEVERITRGR